MTGLSEMTTGGAPAASTDGEVTRAIERVARRVVAATSDGLLHVSTGELLLVGAPVDAVCPTGDVVWALTDHRHLHRIERGTARTVASLTGGARASCLAVHAGSIWAAGASAHVWRLSGDGFVPVDSFDLAPTHEEWHTPWGGPPAVFSMASAGDELFVGVHVGGILRTDDDGASWSSTIDLHVDVHQVVVDAAGGLWAATGMRGLAHSTDRGRTWRFHTDGLHATYLLAVAVTTGGVLVGASSGHAATDGALHRFEGTRFERCAVGLPAELGGAVSPRHLVADGSDAAVALPDGGVYVSADGGRTWARVATIDDAVAELALVPIDRFDAATTGAAT